MASLVLIPDVQEFISLLGMQHNDQFQITEIDVAKNIHLGELNLWQHTGCTIIGIKLANGKYQRNPHPTYTAMPGERLLVMGSKQQVEPAEKRLS